MKGETKVLIVDDDFNFSRSLSKILTKKGFPTTMAKDGTEAIDLVKRESFNVVLMDMKMPVMNGVEAFKEIKKIKKDSVVIFMTAFSMEDLIKEAIHEGAYAVLRKPFDIDMAVNTIRKSQEGAFIAVVDDDHNFTTTVRNVFQQKGYSVTVCESGEEAIALAKERRQDIFFIDMKLPALNGLETYLELKKVNPKATMVVMTAYRHEMEDRVEKAINDGAYNCLYKPLDLNKTTELIEEISKKFKGQPA